MLGLKIQTKEVAFTGCPLRDLKVDIFSNSNNRTTKYSNVCIKFWSIERRYAAFSMFIQQSGFMERLNQIVLDSEETWAKETPMCQRVYVLVEEVWLKQAVFKCVTTLDVKCCPVGTDFHRAPNMGLIWSGGLRGFSFKMKLILSVEWEPTSWEKKEESCSRGGDATGSGAGCVNMRGSLDLKMGRGILHLKNWRKFIHGLSTEMGGRVLPKFGTVAHEGWEGPRGVTILSWKQEEDSGNFTQTSDIIRFVLKKFLV